MKNLINFSFYVLLFLVLPMYLSAQSNLIVGGNAGVNFSKFKYKNDLKNIFTTTDAGFGINGGINLGIELRKFAFLTGVFYQSKNPRAETDNFPLRDGNVGFYEVKQKLNYLSVPLLLRYKAIGENAGIAIAIGPTLNIGINGEIEETIESTSGATETNNYEASFGDGINDGYNKVQTSFTISPSLFLPVGESGRMTFNIMFDFGMSNSFNERNVNALGIDGAAISKSTFFTIGYEHLIDIGDKY